MEPNENELPDPDELLAQQRRRGRVGAAAALGTLIVVGGVVFVGYVVSRPVTCGESNPRGLSVIGYASIGISATHCSDEVNRNAVCDAATPEASRDGPAEHRPYSCGCALGPNQVGEVEIDLCNYAPGRDCSTVGRALGIIRLTDAGGGRPAVSRICSRFSGFDVTIER